ncbi:MAG: hypothetical protein GY930_13270 [bacterium]|nr:hypothetical protein [bacterium]
MKLALLTLMSISPLLCSAMPAPILMAPAQEAEGVEAQIADMRKELQNYAEQIDKLKSANARLQEELESSTNYAQFKEEYLVSSIFVAKHVRGNELAELAAQVFGRSVRFIPTGSHLDERFMTQRFRFTAFPNGEHIIVTDFPGQMDKALAFLSSLDVGLTVDDTASPKRPANEVMLYSPRALDTDQIIALLDTGPRDGLSVTPVIGTNSVRLEGTRVNLEEAVTKLEVSDCYAPQVRIKGYLIQASDSDKIKSNVALPKPLVSGLQGALPGQQFAGIASLFLQCSAGEGQSIATRTSPRGKAGDMEIKDWTLSARMDSYDSEAGLLSLDTCTFRVTVPNVHKNGVDVEELSVDLVIRKDEFTVVGSILGGSMYLVLSFEEI